MVTTQEKSPEQRSGLVADTLNDRGIWSSSVAGTEAILHRLRLVLNLPPAGDRTLANWQRKSIEPVEVRP